MSMQLRGGPVTALLAACCLLPIGCTGPAAAADSTPPILEWNVADLDGLGIWKDYPANARGGVSEPAALRITLRVKDPEGIKLMTIGGSWTWRCTGKYPASSKFDDEAAPQTQTFAPTTSGKVLTEFGTLVNVYKFECPAGQSYAGGSITMNGSASNYSDGVATGKLELGVRPKEECDPGYYCAQGD
jgi:hypothetical protein